jgi:hypothetical protein
MNLSENAKTVLAYLADPTRPNPDETLADHEIWTAERDLERAGLAMRLDGDLVITQAGLVLA